MPEDAYLASGRHQILGLAESRGHAFKYGVQQILKERSLEENDPEITT